jgi:hypothetical protein
MGEFSDNTFAGGNSPTDVIGYQQIDQMIHSPVNENLKQLWDGCLQVSKEPILFSNLRIKLNFKAKPNQTRFLRAYYQFELVNGLVVFL